MWASLGAPRTQAGLSPGGAWSCPPVALGIEGRARGVEEDGHLLAAHGLLGEARRWGHGVRPAVLHGGGGPLQRLIRALVNRHVRDLRHGYTEAHGCDGDGTAAGAGWSLHASAIFNEFQ